MDQNSQAPLVVQPLGPKPEEVNKSKSKLVPALLVITLLLIAGVGYLFLNSKKSPSPKISQSTSTITQSNVQMKTDVELTGKLHKISEDLGLIIQTPDQIDNSNHVNVAYYEAGVFTHGNYKDYKRYLIVIPSGGSVIPNVFIVATKDNKKYILDGDPVDLESQKKNDYDPLSQINKAKISKITPFDTPHPKIIPLDSNFALNKGDLVATTTSDDTGKKTKDGYDIYESNSFLITDFSSYSTLKSPDPKLNLFAGKRPASFHDPTITITPAPEDIYIDATTQVIAVDSTGLAYSYDLTNPQQATDYPDNRKIYLKKLAEVEKSKSTNYPEYPNRPSLRLAKSDIKTAEKIYDKYDISFPVACAMDVNTPIIRNIGDLRKIGTSKYGDIFTLTDKNHALNKAEFDSKMRYYNDKDSIALFEEMNHRKKPTADEYLSQNPLLFFKDYWGRWVALGEYDLQLPGGCGKPVVYLYPEKPTKVSLKFTTPITFDISIPTYKNGWNVLAQPDGTLKDLQPEFTKCDEIDENKKGSEYAKSACESNQYPYLYWAGQSTEKQYPTITKGWIVERKNLSGFLNRKLDEVGFNNKEKSDFLEYWLPEMQNKKANYYRISFLGTQEMNSIAPMQIIPQPKNIFRLFLDYSAFTNKPATITPQNLAKIVRDGFTVVEWGGLKGVSLR